MLAAVPAHTGHVVATRFHVEMLLIPWSRVMQSGHYGMAAMGTVTGRRECGRVRVHS